MKKVAVIHYMPLEFYPPITNLLDIVAGLDIKTKVWSTFNNKKRPASEGAYKDCIRRVAFPLLNDHVIVRLFKYFNFNISCFLGLLRYNPDVIVYYETYSAFPVFLYSKLFKKGKLYCIHYHEYESPLEYKSGMKLVRFYHKLEKKYIYPIADWISQTNIDRLNLFAKDHPRIRPEILKVMPNYPPQKWITKISKKAKSDFSVPLKTVYVGALSLKDTFIKDYCEWVIQQNGRVVFHIYSYNLHEDTITYINELNANVIRFFNKGLDYNEIPKVLTDYDVGVILYKALTKNYKFNAPNKLFEYLASGLSVIYPDVMKGIRPYASPNVVSMNFSQLPKTEELLDRIQLADYDDFPYIAENAYSELIKRIQNHS